MANILAVGNATIDIINTVDAYPREDEEIRAISQRIARGGNAANTLVVLHQLGHAGWWAGTLADEPNTQYIRNDLARFHIDTRYSRTVSPGTAPTSYVALSRHNGSRTIIHYRDLPEFDYESFAAIPLHRFDWIHFEARNVPDTRKMLDLIRMKIPKMRVSIEIEKPRIDVDTLFAYADVLLFSRAFAQAFDASDGHTFLRRIKGDYNLRADLYCTWGAQGAVALSQYNEQFYRTAIESVHVIDTLGAGDTFNAAVIDGHVRWQSIEQTLHQACEVAGKKCGKIGLELD